MANDIYKSFLNTGDSDLTHLHLRLPSDIVSQIDEALECLPIRTRENFAKAAILWALESMKAAAAITMMGLE